MGEGSHLVICDALAAGRGCTRVRVIAHADELGRCVDVNAVGTLELVAVAEANAAVDLLVRRNRVIRGKQVPGERGPSWRRKSLGPMAKLRGRKTR